MGKILFLGFNNVYKVPSQHLILNDMALTFRLCLGTLNSNLDFKSINLKCLDFKSIVFKYH